MNLEALKIDGVSAGTLCTLKWPPLPDSAERVLHLAWPLLQRPGAFLVALPSTLPTMGPGPLRRRRRGRRGLQLPSWRSR